MSGCDVSRSAAPLPDELAEGIDAQVKRTGKTKSEVVRESLKLAGVRVVRHDAAKTAELMRRAAALRTSQSELTDVVALLDEVRGGSLRLRLLRLTVPSWRWIWLDEPRRV